MSECPLDAIWLSLDEDKPLGIWWSICNLGDCGVIDLDDFLTESLASMSPSQAEKYAARFEKYVAELRAIGADRSSAGPS